jgi:hypothetical protein
MGFSIALGMLEMSYFFILLSQYRLNFLFSKTEEHSRLSDFSGLSFFTLGFKKTPRFVVFRKMENSAIP